MPVDKRMMLTTACAIVVGISAVVISKKKESHLSQIPVGEIVVPGAAPTAESLALGLRITVTQAGLTVVVPDCNIEKYPDDFFVHVFQKPYEATSKYASFDFKFAAEKAIKVVVNGKNACAYRKNFNDVSVASVTLGQFAVPGGACCKILWSRNYVFDQTAIAGNE